MTPASHASSSAAVDQRLVTAWLATPDAYAEHPSHVEHIETHISHVFLTDRFAYKLKKGVRFPFVDFSTPALRERACREELRLNRRLARDVYLDVLPISLDAVGQPTFAAGDGPIDWVVRMRRLPADRMLDDLIRKRRLTEHDVGRLVEFLAGYYAAGEPLVVRPDDYRSELEAHVRANRAALAAGDGVDAAVVRRAHTAQLRSLWCRADLFTERVLDGRILDGHGDLRPEHICVIDPPAVFDCLEFSAELRRVDVVDELGFLAMECDLLDAGDVGRRVLDGYAVKSHDHPPPELLTFYKSYRAAVRAKVTMLRAAQLGGAAGDEQRRLSQRYLHAADDYYRAAGERPLLVIVTGLMGTGKSTLARAIGDKLGVEVVRTDAVRADLNAADGHEARYGEGRYHPEARSAVYEQLFDIARTKLAVDESLVLDGCFPRIDWRAAAVAAARDAGADSLLIECVCPRAVSLERVERRRRDGDGDPSEARPELYDRQAAEWQTASGSPPLRVDTTDSLADQLAAVARAAARRTS